MRALWACARLNLPVLVWGTPGTGKTSFVFKMGEVLGMAVVRLLLQQLRPDEVAGIQYIKEGRTVTAPPEWAVRLSNEPGILFLDELSTAPPLNQAAALAIVAERTVGPVRLHPETRVVAAANPVDMAAGGFLLSAPMSNRLVHLHHRFDVGEFVSGVLGGWDVQLPDFPGVAQHEPRARRLLASFASSAGHLINVPPDDEVKASGPWPSPRSWERFVLPATSLWLADGDWRDPAEDIMAGAVGEEAAAAYIAFLRGRMKVSPEAALQDPEGTTLPPDLESLSGLAQGVVALLQTNLSQGWYEAAWRLVLRIKDETDAPDVSIMLARELARIRKEAQGRGVVLSVPRGAVVALVPLLRKAGIDV